MKIAWPPLQTSTTERAPRPVHSETLIETDMPELVIAYRGEETWIGVLCEAGRGGACTWAYAPISSVEHRAVLAGAADIRECFQKPIALVVYESDGKELVAEIAGDAIPDDALPSRGFVLPEWARPKLATATMQSPGQFALARVRGGSAIGLRALAGISDKIQRLYVAVTQRIIDGSAKMAGSVSSVVREAAELDVETVLAGSLLINVRPHDIARFEESSEVIRRLLTTTDPRELDSLLRDLGGRVVGRYEDLLEEVICHDLAMMMSWGNERAAFVASHTAASRINAMPATTEREEDVWAARGYLVGLDPGEKSFTFFDLRSDVEIKGELASTFVVPQNIAVGMTSPIRVVEIGRSKHSTRGGHEVVRHRLVRIYADGDSSSTARTN